MPPENSTLTGSQPISSTDQVRGLQRLAQHLICAGLGMLGGAVGTALAIGLAIIAQLVLFPTSAALPGLIPLNLMAVVLGLIASWLIGWTGYRVIPSLASSNSDQQGIQVIFIFSGLVSLLETMLYMYA